MKPQRNKIETTQFTMRLENNLYQIIKDNAKKYKRSIAKEIEFELEEFNKQNL